MRKKGSKYESRYMHGGQVGSPGAGGTKGALKGSPRRAKKGTKARGSGAATRGNRFSGTA
jgi:hypothetical protein